MITFAEPALRETIGCGEPDARRALDLVAANQAALEEA